MSLKKYSVILHYKHASGEDVRLVLKDKDKYDKPSWYGDTGFFMPYITDINEARKIAIYPGNFYFSAEAHLSGVKNEEDIDWYTEIVEYKPSVIETIDAENRRRYRIEEALSQFKEKIHPDDRELLISEGIVNIPEGF